MTDDLWFRADPLPRRRPRRDRSGRSTAGWVGLGLVALWFVLFVVCSDLDQAARAADAASHTARPPLADPPPSVARPEFLVGLAGIAALPAALSVVLCGYLGVVRGWRRGRTVGWVALVVGAVGLLPALAACLLGLLVCALTVGVVA